MAEPRIFFYQPTAPTMALLSNVTFLAADGSAAIKAGDTSGVQHIAIWNNPWDTRTSGSSPIMPPGSPPTGGYGNSLDGVADATSVDVTARDTGGGTTTAPVTGAWTHVFFPGGGGADAGALVAGGKAVGFPSGASVAAGIGTIANNNYFLVDLTLQPPGAAAAGNVQYVLRVSYSFT